MAATPFPNQPPPYEGRNLVRGDPVLVDAVRQLGLPAAGVAELERWGGVLGSAAVFADAAAANRVVPRLLTHDRRGERIDAIEFDAAWHRLMALAVAQREHNAPWSDASGHAQTVRAIAYYLHAQVENGTQCPLTMTYAAIPLLQRHADVGGIGARFLARALSDCYDPVDSVVDAKQGALFGMGMTERQGGSDVRANVTTAERVGEHHVLRGHKWFFSAPQCDAHLVLAQTAEGPGCFFVPRWLEDGTRNAIRIERLKDKLGNRSNASAEVAFDDAHAWLLGEPGRGIATILDMVQRTRLDCVIGSAGIMRGALAWALHWATHRVAFGRRLVDQPLMINVLADLALETEDALQLELSLAASLGRAVARACAAPRAGGQVLGLQARADGRARGDGGDGRQRLRRGAALAAPLSRSAGELHLGGLGQRDLSRRPARDAAPSRGDRCAARHAARRAWRRRRPRSRRSAARYAHRRCSGCARRSPPRAGGGHDRRRCVARAALACAGRRGVLPLALA